MAANDVADMLLRIDATTEGLRRELKRADDTVAKSTAKINKQVSVVDKKFDEMSKSVKRSMAGVGAALSVAGLAKFTKSVSQAAQSIQSIERTFAAATGSVKAGGEELAFVRAEADRLGLNLETTAKSYGKLAAAAKGTSLEGKAARDVFTAVSEASTALGLSSEQSEGALNALQQMISKGTVQAEELRGQLGERIPGAFQLASRAMGVTTAQLGKMLENGEVLAEDLLPKLAIELSNTFGAQAAEGANQLTAQLNRLDTAVFNIFASADVSTFSDSIADLAETLSDPRVKKGLADLSSGLISLVGWAGKGAAALSELAQASGEVTAEFVLQQQEGSRLYNMLTLSNPIGLAVAGVQAVIGREVRNTTYELQEFSGKVSDIIPAVTSYFDEMETGEGVLQRQARAAQQASGIMMQYAVEKRKLTAAEIEANEAMEKATASFEKQREQLERQISLVLSGVTAQEAAARAAYEAKGMSKEQAATLAELSVRYKELTKATKEQVSAEEKHEASVLSQLPALREQIRLLNSGYSPEQARYMSDLAHATSDVEREQIKLNRQLDLAVDAYNDNQKAIDDLAKESAGAMDEFLNASFGDGLAEGFNQGSKALASFIDGFGELLSVQELYNKAMQDPKADEKKRGEAAIKYQAAQIGLYGDMAAASKQFFDEGSSGYEALQKAEQAFRALEIGMATESLAVKLFGIQSATTATIASVAPTVAAEGAKATAAGAAAAASSMVGVPFPANLGALGATIAALAAIGVLIGGGGGGGGVTESTSQAAQRTQGTGGVLGDASAKADSSLKALELMEDHLSDGLKVSNSMLSELRTLNTNIAGLGAMLSRQLDFEGGLIDFKSQSSLGGAGSLVSDFMINTLDPVMPGFAEKFDDLMGGIAGSIGGAISSKTSKKVDEGIQVLGGNVADILNGSVLDALAYAKIRTKKRSLTGGTDTSYSVITESLGNDLSNEITGVIGGIYTVVDDAIKSLGVGDLGLAGEFGGISISSKGLTDAEFLKELNAVISQLANDVAGDAIPALHDYRVSGEELLETLARVGVQVELFKDSSEALGISLEGFSNGEILTLADDLATLAGGVDKFAANLKAYDEFALTDADRLARTGKQLAEMFARLGYDSLPTTRDAVKDIVEGLDKTTESGQEAFTAITSASSLMSDYYGSQESAAASLAKAGKAAAAAAYEAERAQESAAYEAEKAHKANTLAAADVLFGLDNLRQILSAQSVARGMTISEGAGAVESMRYHARFSGISAGIDQLFSSLNIGKQMEAFKFIGADAQFQGAYDNLLAAYDAQAEAAEKTADAIQSTLDPLRELARTSVGAVDTPVQNLHRLNQEFEKLSALGRGGDVDALSKLSGVGSSLIDSITANASSAFEAAEQIAAVQASLGMTVSGASAAVSAEEEQLAILRDELGIQQSIKESIDAGVFVIADEMAALNKSMQGVSKTIYYDAVTQLNRGGGGSTMEVPSAALIAARERAGLPTDPNKEIREELQAQREEMRIALAVIAKNTKDTSKAFERFDGNTGLNVKVVS